MHYDERRELEVGLLRRPAGRREGRESSSPAPSNTADHFIARMPSGIPVRSSSSQVLRWPNESTIDRAILAPIGLPAEEKGVGETPSCPAVGRMPLWLTLYRRTAFRLNSGVCATSTPLNTMIDSPTRIRHRLLNEGDETFQFLVIETPRRVDRRSFCGERTGKTSPVRIRGTEPTAPEER